MKKIIIPLAIASLAISTITTAEDRYDNNVYINDSYDHEHMDFARVVESQPIYETIAYDEPVNQCRYEKRMVRRDGGSKTGVILGSLIGGAIGNELGHNKSNKRVGAVAGAILGGSIAKDMQNTKNGYHTTRERVCTTTQQVRYKQEITGYNVSYKYRGRTYNTVMDQQPGERIRIAVSVRPVDA